MLVLIWLCFIDAFDFQTICLFLCARNHRKALAPPNGFDKALVPQRSFWYRTGRAVSAVRRSAIPYWCVTHTRERSVLVIVIVIAGTAAVGASVVGACVGASVVGAGVGNGNV